MIARKGIPVANSNMYAALLCPKRTRRISGSNFLSQSDGFRYQTLHGLTSIITTVTGLYAPNPFLPRPSRLYSKSIRPFSKIIYFKLTYTNWSRTLSNRLHALANWSLADQWYLGKTTGYHLDGILWKEIYKNERHLGASYSLICVNKTSGEPSFGRDKSTSLGPSRVEAKRSGAKRAWGKWPQLDYSHPCF